MKSTPNKDVISTSQAKAKTEWWEETHETLAQQAQTPKV